MFLSRSLLVATVFLSLGISSAKAEVFQWTDQESEMSVTFPDRWRVVHTQKPDEVLSIMAPGVNDYAGCRMRVAQDRRFVIYPRYLDTHIQRVNVSRRFWENYVAEFSEATLHETRDDVGLSAGFAGYAEASFTTDKGPRVEKRGIMLASIYNGKRYVVECSAQKDVFAKWYRPFLSVMKSVQLRHETHINMAGNYRNFMGDPPVRVYGRRAIDLYEY